MRPVDTTNRDKLTEEIFSSPLFVFFSFCVESPLQLVRQNHRDKMDQTKIYIVMIHGYPSRVQVGGGHILGHLIIWAGAVRQKTAKKKQPKSKV